MRAIIADETIFELLASGSYRQYRSVLREHFSKRAQLYVLSETLLFLYREQKLTLPDCIFEPFQLFSPEPSAIREALHLSAIKSIPFRRAILAVCSRRYRMSIAITSHKYYQTVPLKHRFFAVW